MEQNQLAKRIAIILDELACLGGSVCVMKAMDVRQFPESYEALSTEAALLAEKITCRLRSLVYATTRVTKSGYLSLACEAHQIEISESKDALQISLPCLLPKKRSRRGSLFVSDPLCSALQSYAECRTLPRFRECVVCFCHVYEKGLFPRQIPDHDNFLQKQVLDDVAACLLTDDSGLFCDLYSTSKAGARSCTQIFVMKKERFPAWLEEQAEGEKSI